jgi:hypothetical protein
MSTLSRRRFAQAAGLTGLEVLAGCAGQTVSPTA